MAGKIALLLFAFTVLVASASADVVLLKNGNRLEGKIIAEDDQKITIRVGKAQFSVARDGIETIIAQETPRDLYRKMLAGLKEDDAEGHYQVALYCIKENLKDEAIELLRRAVELNPDFQKAADELKQLATDVTEDDFRKAVQYIRRENEAAGLKLLSGIVADYPESSYVLKARTAMAKIYTAREDYRAAMLQWKDVIAADRQNTEAYLSVVDICLQVGQFEKAAEILTGVLAYEDDPEIIEGCRRKREVLEGLLAAEKQIEQDPHNPRLYVQAAQYYEALKMPQQAAWLREQAVNEKTTDIRAVEKAARYFDEKLRVARAYRYWSYLATLRPDAELAAEAEQRIAELKVLKLIPEYLACDDAARRREIIRHVEAADLDVKLVEQIVRKWIDFEAPETKGLGTHELDINGQKRSYVLFVPEDYDPDVRWPLIVALHGYGGTGDRYIFTWTKHAQENGYLVLAPTSDQKSGWNDTVGEEIMLASLHDVRKNFNIDPNRIYIDGTSMGGQGAWSYSMENPDLFAGMISRSGAVNPLMKLLLTNTKNYPIYVVHGMKDNLVPYKVVKPIRDILTNLGTEFVFRIDPKSGHSAFSSETPRIIDWMQSHVRDPYPRELTYSMFDLRRPQCFWVQAEVLDEDSFDPDAPIKVPKIAGKPMPAEMQENYMYSHAKEQLAKLSAKVTGNTIFVKAAHVIGYTVFFDDKIMNLDHPVEVYTNGTISYRGKIERSIPFLLEFARRYQDPEMIFSGYLRLTLPEEQS